MAAPEKIEDRTYKFSLRIIRLVRALPKDYASRAIGQQVLRSGTGIGANIEEAIGASTKKDFTNKMAIAYKRSTRNPLLAPLDARRGNGGRQAYRATYSGSV